MNILKKIGIVHMLLSLSACNAQPLDNKKIDTSHPRYKKGMYNISKSSKPMADLVKKYKKTPSISLEEVYADAALIARAYKAYVKNHDWIGSKWNMGRASYQNVAYTIYPKMKEMYPELATINLDYYLQKKQETDNIDAQSLKNIRNMAIVEYAARDWWNNYKDYLLIADQNFFQDNSADDNDIVLDAKEYATEQDLYNALFAQLSQAKKELPVIWTVDRGSDENPPQLVLKECDTSHPYYKKCIHNINEFSKPITHLVEKYTKANTPIPLQEVYTDAEIIAKAYQIYAENYKWINLEWNMCRAFHQDIAYTIYSKMIEMHPELAKINLRYYLQKRHESDNINETSLKNIKNMALMGHAANTESNSYKDYLHMAHQMFFQRNP